MGGAACCAKVPEDTAEAIMVGKIARNQQEQKGADSVQSTSSMLKDIDQMKTSTAKKTVKKNGNKNDHEPLLEDEDIYMTKPGPQILINQQDNDVKSDEGTEWGRGNELNDDMSAMGSQMPMFS